MLETDRTDLLVRYIRTCWIIKIRLMSARRRLWEKEVSLIHLENAGLQLRKICEGVMHLAIIAGEIEFGDLPKGLRKLHQVGKVLKLLDKNDRLKFPLRARLELSEEKAQGSIWKLNVSDRQIRGDLDRVIAVWNRTGNLMHERTAFKDWPGEREEAVHSLSHDLNAIRADHQFLWNFLWQHSMRLTATEVFFLNMLNMDTATRPQIVSMEDFVEGNLHFDFDPDYFTDFTGEIDWSEYDDHAEMSEREA